MATAPEVDDSDLAFLRTLVEKTNEDAQVARDHTFRMAELLRGIINAVDSAEKKIS